MTVCEYMCFESTFCCNEQKANAFILKDGLKKPVIALTKHKNGRLLIFEDNLSYTLPIDDVFILDNQL